MECYKWDLGLDAQDWKALTMLLLATTKMTYWHLVSVRLLVRKIADAKTT